MINLLKKYWHNYKLQKGLTLFEKTGVTSPSSYSALRQMFIFTSGVSNDEISLAISKKQGKYDDLTGKGILGDLSKDELNKMVGVMKRDGYYIFDKELPQDLVNELYNYGLTIPCNYLDVITNDYSAEQVTFDPKHPVSPRYQFSGDSIINLPVIQKLLFDQSLLAFAQEYLGTKPILDLIAFWWSLPFAGKGKSAAAQMYHFDMDRIKFMKFFFYLTDVDTNTGPHCYVKGSHQTLPKSLSRDGRFTDEEIEKTYGSENLIEICGKRGAIIAVDTRGFHKGKELLNDTRLLFQIEFANSMFGQTYPPIPVKYINEDIKSIAQKYPHTYGQVFIEENQGKKD
jgi:hypothetical protein